MVILVVLNTCLRTLDNPALSYALAKGAASGGSVIACYIEDPTQRLPGAAFTWWTRKSLSLFQKQLAKLNVPLLCIRGALPSIAQALVENASEKTRVTDVYINRRWGGTTATEDARFVQVWKESKASVSLYTAHTLHEPWELKTGQGNPYRVYTAFSKHFSAIKPQLIDEPSAQTADSGIREAFYQMLDDNEHVELLDWDDPKSTFDPPWAKDFNWEPGTAGAQRVLDTFLSERIDEYGKARDIPFENGTSQLSPHLAHGEISPHRVLDAVRKKRAQLKNDKDPSAVDSANTFEKELVWREFQYHLLFHEPDLAESNHNPRFDGLDWSQPASEHDIRSSLRSSKISHQTMGRLQMTAAFECWKSGHTGIPMVDAGMRQLWKTGWMHNRVRMIVASLLTKNLRLHWRLGEQWFWDTLVDADPASNPGNWQWTAGTGADASPFFRIFNPARQADNFDDRCSYVRTWIPELKSVSTKEIQHAYENPSTAQDDPSYVAALENPSPSSAWAYHLNSMTPTESYDEASLSNEEKLFPEDQPLFRPSAISKPETAYRPCIVNLKRSREAALASFKASGNASRKQMPEQAGSPHAPKRLKSE